MSYARYPAPKHQGARWVELDGSTANVYPLDGYGDRTGSFAASPAEFQNATSIVVEGLLVENAAAADTVFHIETQADSTVRFSMTIPSTLTDVPRYFPLGDPGIHFSEPIGFQVDQSDVDVFVFYRVIQ